MWRWLCLCCSLWAVSWSVAAADSSSESMRPQDHLMAIGPALRNLDYKGVFAYEQGGQKFSQQWVHAVRNGIEYDRLLGLDGAHREILRERPVECRQRSEQAIHDRLMSSLSGDVASLAQSYDFTMGQTQTVAGRSAWEILVNPRDDFRFGYRLFVDQETHLLLGADRLDKSGNPIEQFRFLTLHVGQVADSDLKPVTASPSRLEAGTCHGPDHERSSGLVASAYWSVDVPAGYSLCSEERSQHEDAIEDALVYSDGLSHFTVFIRHQSEAEQSGRLQQGNTLLRSQTIDIGGALYVVTVVGEIPEVTASRVIAGIKPITSQ